MTIFIGFGHRSGHGKDTAAKFLSTHLRCKCPGLKIRTVPFATKLKAMCHDLFGWAGVQQAIHYENNRDDRYKVLPALGMDTNSLWVLYGEKMREINQKIWANWVLETEHGADIVLIPDTRHPNEVAAIQAKGGEAHKVYNPRVPNREGASIDDMLEGFTGWDGEFLNDSGLEKMMNLMDAFSGHLIQKYNLG